MNPGQSYNVSITWTNRGVLWDSDHGFKLGATGDSDPFRRVQPGGHERRGRTGQHLYLQTSP